jgi:hypothetical protein
MVLKHRQVDHLECPGIRCGQHDRRGDSGLQRLQPTLSHHAPPVAGPQTGKAESGRGRDQVIAETALMIKEFARHDCTYQMDGLIWSTGTAAIAIKAGNRVRAANLQFATEDIRFTLHNPSLD